MMVGMKMKELVERYVRHRCRRLAPGSRGNVERYLVRLACEWDKTRRLPSSLDEHWMAEFVTLLKEGRVGGAGRTQQVSSYNKAMAYYRPFVRYLIDVARVSPRVLDACQDLPNDDERKQYLRLSMAQIVHMIESTDDPWERWVLALASQTLGREGEILGRKVGHLQIQRGVLAWYRPKTARREAIPHDEMPLTNEFVMEWQRWAYVYQTECGSLRPEYRLIPGRRRCGGGTMWRYFPEVKPRLVSHIVQKHAARAAGVDQATLKGQGVHIMRRSMARALYDRLVQEEVYEPLTRVQATLGHSTPQTTMRYIGLDPDREARNKLLGGSSLLWVPRDNVIQFPAGEQAN